MDLKITEAIKQLEDLKRERKRNRHLKREEGRKRKFDSMTEEEKGVIRSKRAAATREHYKKHKDHSRLDVFRKYSPLCDIKAYPTKDSDLIKLVWGSMKEFTNYAKETLRTQERFFIPSRDLQSLMEKVVTVNPSDPRFNFIDPKADEIKEWLRGRYDMVKDNIETCWLMYHQYYIPPYFAFRKAAEYGCFYICQIIRDRFYISSTEEGKTIQWGPHLIKAGEWPVGVDHCKSLINLARSFENREQAIRLRKKMLSEFG